MMIYIVFSLQRNNIFFFFTKRKTRPQSALMSLFFVLFSLSAKVVNMLINSLIPYFHTSPLFDASVDDGIVALQTEMIDAGDVAKSSLNSNTLPQLPP